MSDAKSYNGWENYETWRVMLEFFEGFDLSDFFSSEPDLADTADWCRDYVEEILTSSGKGITLDYALSFISAVNWHQIASHLIDDATFETSED